MAEDAKNPAVDKAAAEKGQAKDEQTPPKTPKKSKTTKASRKNPKSVKGTEAIPEAEIIDEIKSDSTTVKTEEVTEHPESVKVAEENASPADTAETPDTEAKAEAEAEAKPKPKAKTKKSVAASTSDADFQAEIREQIENCKFEIIAELQQSVHNELKYVMRDQVRKVERRRITGTIIRDILILLLAAVVGYFGYCLYEVDYFNILPPACEETESCDSDDSNTDQTEPEVIKDLAWYKKNYGNLFDNLQTNLDADKVSAYYLYSGDYRVNDISTEYLLSMSYNQLRNNSSYHTETGIVIPANDLRLAFMDTFGSTDNFAKRNFTHDCLTFNYNQADDNFTAPNITCDHNSSRQILEEITEIYEEGNALYFLTTATIYDTAENTYYTFDNLFRPVATGVTAENLSDYSGLLNKYQYQFKRTDDRFYFAGITKLK